MKLVCRHVSVILEKESQKPNIHKTTKVTMKETRDLAAKRATVY